MISVIGKQKSTLVLEIVPYFVGSIPSIESGVENVVDLPQPTKHLEAFLYGTKLWMFQVYGHRSR
ncbi:MAG: hypothetical protein ACK5TC_03960 [bacterium]|jgi:hypothetical protein